MTNDRMTAREKFDFLLPRVYSMKTRGIVFEKAMEELTKLWEMAKAEEDKE